MVLVRTMETPPDIIDKGKMRINVYDRQQGTPLANARVSISYTGNPETVINEVMTDSEGAVNLDELLTPPIEYSMEPGEKQPFSEYTIDVTANGYDEANISGIDVFSGETSIQDVYMNENSYQDTENNIVKYLANILMDNTLIKKILLELEKNKKLTLKQVKNILINEMPFIDATDKIWEQYSKVMCKWLSAATMVNMDKNNTISTNNLGREIGDFLSDEIFFPTTMLAQIIKVVELLADNKEGMTIQELKKSMKRSSLNGHLIDACFLGLVRPISRSEYEITQNGLEFLGKEPNEKRAYIREKLLGLEYVCQYLEQIKTTNKEPLEVFTNILDEMKVDKWNEVSIKWKHKLLRNWLIYSKLVVGKTHKKQVD